MADRILVLRGANSRSPAGHPRCRLLRAPAGGARAVASGDAALERQFPRVTADLACWTAAAKAQRERAAPPC